MNKAPSFQQYPDKWLADTRLLSWPAKGIYADLLNVIWMQYQDVCSIPDHPDHIAREIGCTVTEWTAARAEIMNAFRPLLVLTENQRLFSNGLWKEHERQRIRREHLSENGRKGGRPKKQKDIFGKPDVKPGSGKADKSLSSPTPASSPTPDADKDKAGGTAPPPPRVTWLTDFDAIWKERFGGNLPYKKASRPLASVVRQYGNERALEGWKKYCAQAEAQYASAAAFAEKAGVWCDNFVSKPLVKDARNMDGAFRISGAKK